MNDCANVSIRDRLPDLVNGTLSESEASTLELHIGGCIDCQQELAVIRGVRTLLVAGAPAVDVARIIAALPTSAAGSAVPAVPMVSAVQVAGRQGSRSWSSWRIAAAITVVVLGGGTIAVMHRAGSGVAPPEPVATTVAADAPVAEASPVAATPSEVASATEAPATSSPSTTASGAEMTVATSVGDLTDTQLAGLINRIEHVEAIPLDAPVHRSVPIVLTDSIGVKDLGGSD